MSNYGYISGMGGGGRRGGRNRKPSIWKKILILIIILAIVCGGAYAGFRYLRARGLSISQFAQNIGKPAQKLLQHQVLMITSPVPLHSQQVTTTMGPSPY